MKILISVLIIFGLISCVSKDKLADMIKENPEIITKSIEANPSTYIEAFQKAARSAQADMAKKREEEEKKKLAEAYDNPLKPEIRKDELFRGNKDAVITLVEYSDFECPFCTRGFETVQSLMKKYGDNLRFVYKHLPLSFHQNAMIASQYYEAARLQDGAKAIKLHDYIFANQSKLKKGGPFLKAYARKIGLDMKKLAKDLNSKEVKARIAADMAEAKKYGIQGTPGFVINGIPVKGAYPVSHFEGIIDELIKRGKLKLK